MEIKVLIPTHKRAGNVPTLKVIHPASLVVAESEVDDYRRAHPKADIIAHPDSIIGLAPKRQWIYERFGNVFMLDDDIQQLMRLYLATMVSTKATRLTPNEAFELVQWCGNTARLAGCFLFGFSKDPNPLLYRPFAPIKLTGMVNGCALGLLEGSKLRFTPETTAVEDFWISGLNAHLHRKAFIDRRFCFVQKGTFQAAGGQSSHRTLETERRDTLFLRRCFGSAITSKAESHGSGSTKSKSKNPYGRTLKIPF